MKRGIVIGLIVATLGIAALQATPSSRDPLNPGDETVDEPEASTPDEVKPEKAPARAEPKANAETKVATAAVTVPRLPEKPTIIQASSLTPIKIDMPAPPSGGSTPMPQRVAVVGLLNKRNGLWQDLVMKPGEARRIGDVVVRLRACETTAPWEHEKLTGAFVQLLVNDTDKKWRRYFSGWLYKESPSLNVVEHPIYDVWTKECRMRHSDVGPNTQIVHGGEGPAERKGEEGE
jgi:hypothetical protein